MTGTEQNSDGLFGAESWVLDSLYALGGVYRFADDGQCYFDGDRPGMDGEIGGKNSGEGLSWHKHGRFGKWLVMLVGGCAHSVQVFKQRWKNRYTGRTVHSRPPDDPVLVRHCTLILFLQIWSWVRTGRGLHNRVCVVEGLDNSASERTISRWLSKMRDSAQLFHQAIRLSIIEQSEPRPVERLFAGGLSPPPEVSQKRWKTPEHIVTLYQGFTMLLVAARELALHVAHLLAGARRRQPNAEKTFGI